MTNSSITRGTVWYGKCEISDLHALHSGSQCLHCMKVEEVGSFLFAPGGGGLLTETELAKPRPTEGARAMAGESRSVPRFGGGH